VEWIDHPAALAGPRNEIDEARVLLDRLLAHDRHAREYPGEADCQPLFGGDISHGDQVARSLFADFAFGEIAEARQQLGCRRLAHQLGDPLGIAGAQHAQPKMPNRSSSFRITWSTPSSFTSVPDHLP